MARKRRMEWEQKGCENQALLEFLLILRAHKQQLMGQISGELARLDRDISRVKQRLQSIGMEGSIQIAPTAINETEPQVPVIQSDRARPAKRPILDSDYHSTSSSGVTSTTVNIPPSSSISAPSSTSVAPSSSAPSSTAEPFVTSPTTLSCDERLLENKRVTIREHFSDLQYEMHIDDPLEHFGQKMARLTRMTRFRLVSNMKFGDLLGSPNIISSIELDRDGHLFATAGVFKKIRFYDFRDATNESLDLHCPVREINTRSKISCLSWNSYIQQQIASADYEGLITVYDANTSAAISHLEEHEKRCWSVEFSPTDPTRIVSGSDDCYVKLWSLRTQKSICTIDGKANVCSVRFHPENGNLILFGSADHSIQLYDLRNIKQPLGVLNGHRKAVSYVRFVGSSEAVSASTDCTLRMWSLGAASAADAVLPSASPRMLRTYSGHVNERNFVGLSVKDDVFVCGSENNTVYAYHRELSKPIATYWFASTCPVTGAEIDNGVQQFVSSVCWKHDSNMLLVANSRGNIQIIELV